MGQIAHIAQQRHGARVSRGLAVVCAALLASPVLTGCGSSLASATTTLAGVQNAQVVHPDGTVVTAVDGLRLRAGDVVRTATKGRAELHTRGRVVYEASDAAVQVLDGARADLRHGALVVDAQHGPGLALTVAGLRLSAHSGGAVRAERSVTVRIATLAGHADLLSPTGRQLEVGALTQAVVGGDALPNSTASTPLRLTDDDGEARAVPPLVRDDLALNSLAAGIDNTGDDTARVVTASWHAGLSPLPNGVGRSEQVLPIVIAAAAGGDTTGNYDQAVQLRQAGASWGVVAHRLGTTSAAVLAALQAFEKGAATGQVGTVPAALAYLSRVGVGSPNGNGNGNRGSGNGGNGGPGSGGSSGGPSPSPSPSSTDLVGGTIDKVLKLLPTPLPTSTPTSLLPVQVPVAVPSVPALPVVGSLVTPAPSALLSH